MTFCDELKGNICLHDPQKYELAFDRNTYYCWKVKARPIWITVGGKPKQKHWVFKSELLYCKMHANTVTIMHLQLYDYTYWRWTVNEGRPTDLGRSAKLRISSQRAIWLQLRSSTMTFWSWLAGGDRHCRLLDSTYSCLTFANIQPHCKICNTTNRNSV